MRVLLAPALVLAYAISFALPSYCQNPDLAKDFAEEGISDQAKIEFLKVLHDPTKKSSYDSAEYYLGYLDFKEKKFDLALKHWNSLLQKYPNSTYSEKAKELITSAYQQLIKQQNLTTQDIEIESLFENATFLVDRPLKVNIDTSYLPSEEMAIEWLEQVVSKYPKTPEAARAVFREGLIYYGWNKSGGSSYSERGGYGFEHQLYDARDKKLASEYVGKMIQVFERLQKEYPDSRYAVPIGFLIGQAYWSLAGGKVDENARVYWTKVVALTANDSASDYRQLAEWRLRNGR
jgi:TolA-binding protein